MNFFKFITNTYPLNHYYALYENIISCNAYTFMMFKDRIHAGKLLAEKLKDYKGKDAIILAIPRGGVVVGYQIAKEINARLDVIVPRKLGAPGNPELAIGAIAEDGSIYLVDEVISQYGIDESYLRDEAEAQLKEIKRRVGVYRGGKDLPKLEGRIVILVDDGLATGATMKAAVSMVSKMNPLELIVAVPVAPPDTVKDISEMVNKVVCLSTPTFFFAIGQFYQDFEQVSDEEVLSLLREF
jgi:predicted phosphoribosyltransferase